MRKSLTNWYKSILWDSATSTSS